MASMASSTSLPMAGCLALGLDLRPASLLRYPEHVLGDLLVPVLQEGVEVLAVVLAVRVSYGRSKVLAVLLEGVGDVLEEEEAKHDVLCSAGSMLLRRRSAASQSFASNPRLPRRSSVSFATDPTGGGCERTPPNLFP